MQKGCVKWFNKTKGYGFIQPEDPTQDDVFIHFTAVERSGLEELSEGQFISYDSSTDPRKGKPTASRIELLSSEVQ